MKKCYIINDKNDSIILNYIFINKLLMLRYLNFKKFEIICGEKYESKEKLKKIVNLIKLIIPDSYIIINSKSNEIINIDKIDEINLISKEDINKNNINKIRNDFLDKIRNIKNNKNKYKISTTFIFSKNNKNTDNEMHRLFKSIKNNVNKVNIKFSSENKRYNNLNYDLEYEIFKNIKYKSDIEKELKLIIAKENNIYTDFLFENIYDCVKEEIINVENKEEYNGKVLYNTSSKRK